MGLYPRACNTLLPIYGEKDCTLLIQDRDKCKQFTDKLEKLEGLIKLLNTPAQIAGLRIIGNVFRGLKKNNDKLKFPKLNYVEKQLKAIEEIPNSNYSVSQLLNENFISNKFTDQINTSAFRVVHLATHGEFSSSPDKTFILASDESIKINQIGEIFRKQAQRQPEPIELLVLSACETATGDKRAT